MSSDKQEQQCRQQQHRLGLRFRHGVVDVARDSDETKNLMQRSQRECVTITPTHSNSPSWDNVHNEMCPTRQKLQQLRQQRYDA